MTIRVSRLVPGSQLTNATATYYTTPASTSAVIKRADFCNNTGGTITFSAYVVPSGGTAVAGNQVISTYSIAANTTYVSPELAGMVLGPGETLQAIASANASVTITVSGITVV